MALIHARGAVLLGGGLLVVTAELGCGSLGHDAPPEPVARDPRTGLVDGPGIEVCLGGTRVVAPSRATGGALSVCVAPVAVERRCSDTSECAAGERCVCGRCVTRPCRNATECEAREVCLGGRCASVCTSASACGPNETCTAGGCARRCGSSADCAYGEQCSALDGTCIVKLCGPSISCGGDQTCVQQEHVADLREPHVTVWSGQRIAYVELREQAGATTSCAVHRARVVSPRRWEIDPVAPVLAPADGDGDCVGAPSVVDAGGRMILYAARGDGTGLIRATSVDGVAFERSPGVIWSATQSWEGGWVGSPGAVSFGGATIVFYAADGGRALGRVQVDETNGHVQMPDTRPVLVPSDVEDPLFWRQMERITAPFPVVRDGVLLLYFQGRGVEGADAEIAAGGAYPADINDSIGLAATRDLVDWELFPSGPILARKANLRAYLGELEPSVWFDEAGGWLVYVGADATGRATTGLGLAASAP